MATLNVSSASQLDDALDSARGGDRIVLAQGNYGELDINGRFFSTFRDEGAVTIASASDSRPAVFNEMDLRNVSNVTLDGLKFDDDDDDGGDGKAFIVYNSDGITIRDSEFEGVVRGGYGASWGLQFLKTEDVTVENNEFRDFTKSSSFIDTQNLVVRGNDYWRASIDSMVFGDVQNVRVENNTVHDQKTNAKHTDMIQFWSETKGGASKDVVIKNNVLYSTADGETHGIFMGNGYVDRTGSRSDFFENVLIEGNTIVSGQYHGLSVRSTDGLTIRNNTVLRDSDAADRAVTTPRIVVADDARDVTITGNTAHLISDNGGRSWNDVPGNTIVPLGTMAGKTPPQDRGREDSDSDVIVDAPEPEAPSTGSGGNGRANTFRFDGDEVSDRDSDRAEGLDFSEGDQLVFIFYDRDTFDDSWKDSNHVANNQAGTFVRIDSLADIQEIGAASGDVDVDVRGDTLVLTIDQNGGTHEIALEGLGQSYDALF